MICKCCGKELDDLSLCCPECLTFVDLDEHEKIVDEKIANGEIKKKFAKQKANRVICEKCGASIKIPETVCTNCTHVINKKAYVNELKELISIVDESDITIDNWGLTVLCYCVPLLGLILKFTYKKTNSVLSKHCFKKWVGGISFRLIVALSVIFLL